MLDEKVIRQGKCYMLSDYLPCQLDKTFESESGHHIKSTIYHAILYSGMKQDPVCNDNVSIILFLTSVQSNLY